MTRNLTTFAFATLVSCGGISSDEADIQALLEILQSDRVAHLETDVSALLAHIADTLVSVDNGEIRVQTRGDVEVFFTEYFRDATYTAWDDVVEPTIRVSADGRMAWVNRTVDVDRESPRFGGFRQRTRFRSAWTATYEKIAAEWQMTSVTSTFAPVPFVERVLEGSRRRLGGVAPVAGVRAIRFTADATSAGGDFVVTVYSGTDGSAHIRFHDGSLAAAVASANAWITESPTGSHEPLTEAMETFVRGHELLMVALAPQTRYGPLRDGGETPFGDNVVMRLLGQDALAGTVELYFAREDTLPVGYRVRDHVRGGEPVTVTFTKWDEHNGLQLIREAEFLQGTERFHYRLREIEVLDAVPDSVLRNPSR